MPQPTASQSRTMSAALPLSVTILLLLNASLVIGFTVTTTSLIHPNNRAALRLPLQSPAALVGLDQTRRTTATMSALWAESKDNNNNNSDLMDGVVELATDEASSSNNNNDDTTAAVGRAPFFSQGEIDPEALNPDFSDPKQTRVIVYIILSLIPVLFLIPLMLGSRELIPLDSIPPVPLN